MEATKNTRSGNRSAAQQLNREALIALYMDYVLEHEKLPGTVYKFGKEHQISEAQFYEHFGSFEGLRKEIWNRFFDTTQDLMHKSPEYLNFNTREKLLTFYYTFFELLTANRSYILFALSQDGGVMKNLQQLKGLRSKVKSFTLDLIEETKDENSQSLIKQSGTIFSEANWLQVLAMLKFWMNDNSAGFESTDIAIEKSVNTVFALLDTTPLERVIDLGKFLYREHRS